jgi:hypothetical protein
MSVFGSKENDSGEAVYERPSTLGRRGGVASKKIVRRQFMIQGQSQPQKSHEDSTGVCVDDDSDETRAKNHQKALTLVSAK